MGSHHQSAADLIDAGLARWNAGEHDGAVSDFDEALRLQRALIASDGLAEHGPAFVRWVDWPIAALLSQDDRYTDHHRDYAGEAVSYARQLADPTLLAPSLIHAGLAQWKSGEHDGAVSDFEEALRLQRALIASDGLAEHGPTFVRWVDWPIAALLSQDDRYIDHHRDHTGEAVSYARQLADPTLLAPSLIHAGLAQWKSGEHDGAVSDFEEALRLQRALIASDGLAEHGPTFVRWVDWPITALLSQDDRYTDDSHDYTYEAVTYARKLEQTPLLAKALIDAGLARWKSGEHDGAVSDFEEALRLQRALIASDGLAEHGPAFVRWVDWPIAALLSQDDRYTDHHRDYAGEAVSYARQLADPTLLAPSLIHAGLAQWKSGEHDGAVSDFEEALRLQRALIASDGLAEHGPTFVRWVDWPVAALLSQDDRYTDHHRDHTGEAVSYARQLADPTLLAPSLIHAGLAQWKSGEHDGAVSDFEEALRLQRALIASDGLAEHGPTFVRWVDWPITALLVQDDRYDILRLALLDEASEITRGLQR